MYCEVLKWRDTIYATQKSHDRGADGILATIVAEGSTDGVISVVGNIVVANTGAKDDVPYILVHLCNPFNRKNWVNSWKNCISAPECMIIWHVNIIDIIENIWQKSRAKINIGDLLEVWPRANNEM